MMYNLEGGLCRKAILMKEQPSKQKQFQLLFYMSFKHGFHGYGNSLKVLKK